MYWTLELASKLEDAPWPATKEELIDYAVRSGAPLEVLENLQEIEDEGDIYESIEDIWPDYPSKDDFFFNEEEYLRLKGCYQLDEAMLRLAPADMPVLHPLPRIDEISTDVDNDPRAAYFEQVQNAVYIRMALIMTLLGLKDPKAEKEGN